MSTAVALIRGAVTGAITRAMTRAVTGVVTAVVVMVWVGATTALLTDPVLGQEAFFQDANALYRDGDFHGAIAGYESVIASGLTSPELHYNLGNAYYRVGSLGPAVLNYERALRLDPSLEDARANLELVKGHLVDRIEPLPGFWMARLADWWIRVVPPNLLWLLSGVFYLATTGGLVWMILAPSRRSSGPLRIGLSVAGALTLVLIATHVLRTVRLGSHAAVVMVPEVTVLSAPADAGGLTVFQIHEGTRVRIDDRSGDWMEVVLEDGKVGWVRQDAVQEI